MSTEQYNVEIDDTGSLAELIAQMRAEFFAHARERARSIEQAAGALATTADCRPLLTALVRDAHMLKGGAGTFGFSELGEAAAEVERIGWNAASGGPLVGLEKAVAFLLEAVGQAAARAA